ncbi:MAG: B12-binding domain-containing protein [Candidatus Aminicenantes bacterium]
MEKLSEAIAELDKQGVLNTVEDYLKAKRDPLEIIEEARKGLERVGEEFEKGHFFLMELMRAAQIFKDASSLITPKIKECYGNASFKGKVLIGTVSGDVHDLGKGIVAGLLECGGFEVVDLGVDVAKQRFIENIREHKPQVVGMSGLLTTSIPVMKETTESIEKAGLREELKVIVGGGVVGEVKSGELGVDYATSNANQGIRVIEEWLRAGRQDKEI